MHYLAKQAIVNHLAHSHFKVIVHRIFKHHAVLLCAFGRVYQLPNVIKGKGGRHFYGNTFAALHGMKGYRYVRKPIGAHVHEVQSLLLA